MPARCNRWFLYCSSYCWLNMFRAPLCPSSGAQGYYTGGCVSGLRDAAASCSNVALRVTLPLSEPLSTTTTGHYTTCCKNLSLTLLKMDKRCPKHAELILEINKLLLLHLVGFSILLYIHWWCRSNTNQV